MSSETRASSTADRASTIRWVTCAAVLASLAVPLRATTTDLEPVPQTGHSFQVRATAFSPDGLIAATAGDSTIKLWDVRTGLLARSLVGHREWVEDLAFTANGSSLVSAARDGARVWDVHTGQVVRVLDGTSGGATVVAISAENRILVGGGSDLWGLWDAATGASVARWVGPDGIATAAAITPDGSLVAVVTSEARDIELRDTATGASRGSLSRHADDLTDIAFSPDGRWLASADVQGRVLIWDPAAGAVIAEYRETAANAIHALGFTREGDSLLAGGASARLGGLIHRIEVPSGRVLSVSHTDEAVLSLDVSTRDDIVLIGRGYSGSAAIWRIDDHEDTDAVVIVSTEAPEARLTTIVATPDGRRCLVGDEQGRIGAWQPGWAEVAWSDASHETPTRWVAISADSSRAASLTADGTLSTWATASRPILQSRSRTRSGTPTALHLDAQGRRMVVAREDGSLEQIDVEEGTTRRVLDAGGGSPITDIDVSGDGEIAATVDGGPRVTMWHLPSGTRIREVEDVSTTDHHAYHSVQFSPDGRSIVATGSLRGGGIQSAWDLPDGTSAPQVHDLTPLPIVDHAFTSDRGGFVYLTEDGNVRQWSTACSESIRVAILGEDLALPASLAASGTSVFFVDHEHRILRRELRDSRVVHELAPPRLAVTSLNFDGDGGRAVVATSGGRVSVWDLSEGRRERVFQDRGSKAIAAISPCGHLLAVHTAAVQRLAGAPEPASLSLWDANSGRHLHDFGGFDGKADAVVFSSDSQLLLIRGEDVGIQVFDALSGQPAWIHEPQQGHVEAMAVSGQGRRLLVATSPLARDAAHGPLAILDFSTGEPLGEVERPDLPIRQITFTRDDQQVLMATADGDLWIGGPQGEAPHPLIEAGGSPVGCVAALPGSRAVVARDVLEIWDLQTRARLDSGEASAATIHQLVASPDGSLFLAGDVTGGVRLFRTDGQALATLLEDADDWLIADDAGHFAASRSGGRLLAATAGLHVYSADQLAVRFNRPDVLLQRLGLGDDATIRRLLARHQLRAHRQGVATDPDHEAPLAPPTARITGNVLADDRVTLTIEVRAGSRSLDRLQLFVDGVPVHPGGGLGVNEQETGIREEVVILPGPNRIEVEATDAAGLRSLRDAIVVHGPAGEPADLYFVGFGVSRYHNPNIRDLRFAHKDVLDLERLLKRARPHFHEVHAATFVDDEVTTEALERARELLSGARVGDTVVLFVSGHGITVEDGEGGFEYRFLTARSDAEAVRETGMPFSELEDLLAATPARSKILLMDTCESGEREVALSPSALADAQAKGLIPRSPRGATPESPAPSSSTPSFWLDRERYLFNDVARRTGAVVFSASRGDQLSYEHGDVRNGLFTEEVIRTLSSPDGDTDEDGAISVEELRTRVSREVSMQTWGSQVPVVDRDNLFSRFSLPLLPPVRDVGQLLHEAGYVMTPMDLDRSRVLVGTTEVTQHLWHIATGTEPYRDGDARWNGRSQGACWDGGVSPDRPAFCVSWIDAIRFCNTLSTLEGLTPAYRIDGEQVSWDRQADGYRLPTDAEWTAAARTEARLERTDGAALDDLAWHADNAPLRTMPVAGRRPGEQGLYDLLGNVDEWIWDSPASSVSLDEVRVSRGGHWCAPPSAIEAGGHESRPATDRTLTTGIRLVRAP